MYRLKFTTEYKRAYKRIKKRGQDLTLPDEVVETLRKGETLDEKYHDPMLKGEFSGFHECYIKLDW